MLKLKEVAATLLAKPAQGPMPNRRKRDRDRERSGGDYEE
jgi:hypothetical protein